MSKIKSPRLKKHLAYQKDHISLAEYPHGFRKLWPKKKAKAQRAERHKARRVIQTMKDDSEISNVHRKNVRKWGSISLRESVRHKLEKRKKRIGSHKARQVKNALEKAEASRV